MVVCIIISCILPPCIKSNSVENHPHGEIAAKIAEYFGFYDVFKTKLKEAALGQFGSGYAWLVYDNGSLEIVKTPNQTFRPYTVKASVTD